MGLEKPTKETFSAIGVLSAKRDFSREEIGLGVIRPKRNGALRVIQRFIEAPLLFQPLCHLHIITEQDVSLILA